MKLHHKILSRTVIADSCRRTAFRFWLADQEDPQVMISPSASIAEAKESLQVTFADCVVRVERIRKASISY